MTAPLAQLRGIGKVFKAASQPLSKVVATAPRRLVLGFAAIIFIGTLLLSLPVSETPGHSISLLDAFFTATSAVCVTGLVIKDLSTDFSLFGQITILLLIQIGGLGYMTMSTFMVLIVGQRISLREQLTLRDSLNLSSMRGLVRFAQSVIGVTLLVEAAGALLLLARFAFDFPLAQAAYLAIFHAVSAFNNAGFSLFSTNLMSYREDWVVNVVVTTLVILGGIGFVVYGDLYRRARGRITRLSLHTKLVLTMTGILIVAGTLFLLLFEFQNPQTLSHRSWPEQLLISYFHAVNARTAGFNTIDLSQLSNAALYLLVLLMFIGASPGGTGGGVKTTTFGTIALDLWTTLRGQVEATLYRRQLPAATVAKSYLIVTLSFFWLTGATLLLLEFEHKDFLRLMFEVTSALGTVGLSTGDGGALSYSALFSNWGKLIIALTMLAGRVGPFTLGIAVLTSQEKSRIRYPQGEVLIG